MKIFSSQSFRKLENSLDYSALKQKVTADNIANVDTPNYKAKSVSFKSALNEAKLHASQTNSKHISFKGSNSEFSIVTNKNNAYNHNGNSVDMDTEMANMAKNQIYYNVLVERMNGKFNSIKDVLKGG